FVKNVALIEELDIGFLSGFNVLTGETGAGKSIVIDAVNLVLGERGSRELIKHGADKARVEAIFDIGGQPGLLSFLEEQGLPCEDGELLLSRELSAAGKNVCRANGALVTLTVLKSITDQLVDVHGQHEHQSLLSKSHHMNYLDAFGGEPVAKARRDVANSARRCKALREEMLDGFGSEDERLREMDVLRYQIAEIERASLKEGEEESLLAERVLVHNAERIMEALAQSGEALSGEDASLSLLGGAMRHMQDIAAFSEDYAALTKRLEDAYYAIEDIGFSLRDLRNGFEYDPRRIDEIENRLEIYRTLKRKYGVDYAAIMNYLENSGDRLTSLEGTAARHEQLEQDLAKATKEYGICAARLTQAREAAAAKLEKGMRQELVDLGFAHADFSVHFQRIEDIAPLGAERAEFLLSANAGEPLKPLEKVASGGEMSRIMLAMKAMFAQGDGIPTLIFDEIDTGISGRVAAVVGEKMVRISDSHQVLCVTHLPQIAALADAHYLVEKREEAGATKTFVRLLTKEQRYTQVAAMMSGANLSSAALEHAKELIDNCEAAKAARRKN
ncbi:MAG: DNA repair protein RecN, partial [Clostridia bacterium]|nr:DNA repair protein RecN [Clostridia bacterium]